MRLHSLVMDSLSGSERFRNLSAGDQARYVKINQSLVRFARDHAVPIVFAPPLSTGGKVNGATGCILQMGEHSFIVTASHVLRGYEKRCGQGEVLNWQVGNLPPFEPRSRFAWRDEEKDIVLLSISEDESLRIGPCIRSTPAHWPPRSPKVDELVLVAGYPKLLREVDPAGTIECGPYSAMFRVTTTGEGYCTCQIEHNDLISFDGGPLPEQGTDMGGISGGPVLLVGNVSYPLVGVITDSCHVSLADFELLRVSTLESVNFK